MTNLPVFATLSREFFTEAFAVLRDTYAAFIYVWKGRKLTPEEAKAWDQRFSETPPAYWHGPSENPKHKGVKRLVEAVAMPETDDYFEPKSGGFAVGWDGSMMYSDRETRAEQRAKREVSLSGEVTEKDYGQMLAYVPKLTNVALAKKIKPLWGEGKSSREIALLAGCSESYVKHYVICFERAGPSPTSG